LGGDLCCGYRRRRQDRRDYGGVGRGGMSVGVAGNGRTGKLVAVSVGRGGMSVGVAGGRTGKLVAVSVGRRGGWIGVVEVGVGV
jgi:hypothetical protein